MRNDERKEKGQSLLEIALVLPVLLIILAGVLDLGRLYYVYVAISDAAGEGATFAAINPDKIDQPEFYQRVQQATGGQVIIDPSMVDVECPNVAGGAPVTVTVGYTFTLATPLLNMIVPGGELPIYAVASEAILK